MAVVQQSACAMTVADALASYLEYLRAERKPGSDWPRIVESIAKNHILPAFGEWSLRELAEVPDTVAAWHKAIQSPVIANRAVEILSALYRRAAKRDRTLNLSHNPTSAVLHHRENVRQVNMPWKEWATAWRAIPDPVLQSFALVELLTGMRGGELSRAQLRGRWLVVPSGKSGADIRVPVSREIIAALRIAGNAGANDWAAARRRLERSGLPIYGHALRHVFETVAVSVKVDPLIRKLLMGHKVSDITDSYAGRGMLSPTLRKEQRRISAEIVRLSKIAL
jgi:hypothetical protein